MTVVGVDRPISRFLLVSCRRFGGVPLTCNDSFTEFEGAKAKADVLAAGGRHCVVFDVENRSEVYAVGPEGVVLDPEDVARLECWVIESEVKQSSGRSTLTAAELVGLLMSASPGEFNPRSSGQTPKDAAGDWEWAV